MLSLRTILAASTIVLVAVIAFGAMMSSADPNLQAQTAGGGQRITPPIPKPAPPREPVAQSPPATPAPAAPATPAAPAADVPVRTETITYDLWTVTCRETVDGKSKKICSAAMPMSLQQQNRVVNVGAWIIARDNDGALVSVIQTPQIDIGVLIPKGVDLKLGEGKPHKINFVDCNPQRCEASLPMDEAIVREFIASANNPAAITFWKTDGAEFTINLPSVKGIDKAIAALR